jgi:hypothetical protein
MKYPQVSESVERIDVAFPEGATQKVVEKSDGSKYTYNKFNAGYSLRIVYPDKYYVTIKNYYPNGVIKEKGASFNANPCPIGQWYFFKEGGNLDRKTDYDQGFRFTIDDVLKFIQGHKIPLIAGEVPDGGVKTEIYRESKNNNPIWIVHWLIKPDLIEIITLSGRDGKVLSKKYEKYDNS